MPLYPRGPRSGPSYAISVPHRLIDPIRPTRQHIATSPQSGLYAMPSLCALPLTPRQPASGSVLSLAYFPDMSPSGTTGSSSAAYTQFLHRWRWPSTSRNSLGASNIPTLRFSWGESFSRLYYGSLSLQPVGLFALLSELTRLSPSQRGLLLPGFRRIGHPLRRRISLRWQLGKFHRRGFHPL